MDFGGQNMKFEELDRIIGDHAPFLMSLSDGLQEELHLVIAAAKVGELGANIPEFSDTDEATRNTLQEILAKARPIEASEKRQYEICFPGYILYQVRDESYCSFDHEEVRHGKYLITFEKSELLSHLSSVTDACQFKDGSFYPGKWTHYGIYTQNHVIDVISHILPVITACEDE